MAYPPPPPPPGAPGPGGYGAPPPGPTGPPGYGGPGYGGPPPGPPGYGGAGYGGPGGPPGYGGGGYGGGAPTPPPSGKGGNRALIVLMGALVVVVVLVVVGALVLVTRGGGDEEVVLTQTQLEGALIDAETVGDGFTTAEDTDSASAEDEEFDRDEVQASEECIDLYEGIASLETADEGVPEASRSFERDDEAEVDITLSGPTEVSLDDLRSIVSTCGEITIDDGENVGTIEFSALEDLPELGDDRAGFRLDVDLDEPFDISVESAAILWERDGTQADVSVTGPLDIETFEGGPADLDLLRRVAEAQDAALQQAIDEAG